MLCKHRDPYRGLRGLTPFQRLCKKKKVELVFIQNHSELVCLKALDSYNVFFQPTSKIKYCLFLNPFKDLRNGPL